MNKLRLCILEKEIGIEQQTHEIVKCETLQYSITHLNVSQNEKELEAP